MNGHIRLLGVCALYLGIMSGVAGTLAQFRTPLGALDVELFDDAKPVTVANFVRYVRGGAYTNMFFHRWKPGFVIQGGGFFVATHSNTNGIEAVPAFAAITNEHDVGRVLSNTYGTLAMARVSGQTNSANSQWFFNLTNNAFLDSVDGGFTVFGRVVRGTNVLERFNNVALTNGIYRAQLPDPLGELPVLSDRPTFRDLVFVDISLLNVEVAALPDGAREISWMSVSNRPNVVEFTATMPPSWNTLLTTNGAGGVLRVRDADPHPARFYRVRVDY